LVEDAEEVFPELRFYGWPHDVRVVLDAILQGGFEIDHIILDGFPYVFSLQIVK
jgi:hypothetical protein